MRPHPHFDDRGTMDWHTRYDEALAQAKEEGKRVFIEMGRLQCSQCRSLIADQYLRLLPGPRCGNRRVRRR
jgi:uncharacterized protein YyaL (SSP411 family)